MVKLLKEKRPGDRLCCLSQDTAAPPCRDGTHQTAFSASSLSPLALIWSSVEEEASRRPATSSRGENEHLKCKQFLPTACARGKLPHLYALEANCFGRIYPLFSRGACSVGHPWDRLGWSFCSFVRFYFMFQISRLRLRI